MERLRSVDRDRIARNLEGVRERIAKAAGRAGRDPAAIRLVAVTKTVEVPVVEALLELGVTDLGESRPEELVRKRLELDRPATWHLIGHFQRKKIPRSLPWCDVVHSVHDLPLLSTLDQKRRAQDPPASPLPVLIQVNASGESSKQGFSTRDAADAIELAEALGYVDARGFMTMAPHDATEAELREVFGRLRDLRDELGAERFPELSMGMSGDFEIAIEEGATLVRIGSALFDGVDEPR
ncbi:MAG: YggS family pyridoxal phosphate-dependent enzyme [Planctomycetota bacterium]